MLQNVLFFQVAYVRFASVYKEFKDIEEFKGALDKLLKKR